MPPAPEPTAPGPTSVRLTSTRRCSPDLPSGHPSHGGPSHRAALPLASLCGAIPTDAAPEALQEQRTPREPVGPPPSRHPAGCRTALVAGRQRGRDTRGEDVEL